VFVIIFSDLDLDLVQSAKEGCGQQNSGQWTFFYKSVQKTEIILAFKIFLHFKESSKIRTKICVQT